MDNAENTKAMGVAEACKLLRRLSGLSVTAYAKEIDVSHTYWKELEAGIKDNPSMKVKKRIADVSGLSLTTIDFLLRGNHPGAEEIYNFIVTKLDNYLKELMPTNQ